MKKVQRKITDDSFYYEIEGLSIENGYKLRESLELLTEKEDQTEVMFYGLNVTEINTLANSIKNENKHSLGDCLEETSMATEEGYHLSDLYRGMELALKMYQDIKIEIPELILKPHQDFSLNTLINVYNYVQDVIINTFENKVKELVEEGLKDVDYDNFSIEEVTGENSNDFTPIMNIEGLNLVIKNLKKDKVNTATTNSKKIR